ncbi:TonB-dependent receptor domain-containing protein [Aridibaculum aurantiacum]|uniref:TonB-dependent receptor domain-containing protein n=1 Tax=Aridibaculum aurantiacum TaxID=2810307 RepID=UPI001A96DF73|nr:TonB-dependent receptor [Aridibaculum aurantiacum]
MRKFYASFRSIGMLAFALLISSIAMAQSVIRGTVRDSLMPLEGASVLLEGQNAGTRTNNTGTYEIRVRPGSYTIIISFVGYQQQRRAVTVGANQTVTVDMTLVKEQTTQVVTVVGSRSVTPRTNIQTASPVDVFSSRELQMTGQIEPTQMINFVAPSFNSSRQTIADGTDHIDPATLRGLGPDQVLVLINGRRRHNTALLNVNGTIGRGSVGTDLNSIPASAIERIEVLRDGASSQYGSDAIAGVVNVVLKRDFKRTLVNLHGGQHYAGDGRTLGASLQQAFRLGKKGFLDVFADARWREGTNRAGDFTGTWYYNIPGGASQAVRDSITRLDNALIQSRGMSRKNTMQVGNSKVDNYGLMINSGIPLTDRINFNLNAGTNFRQGQSAGFYRFPKQTTQVIQDLYPDGFLPLINSTIRDNNLAASIDGITKGGVRWDFGSQWGANSFLFDITNTNNASQFAEGLNAQTEFYAGKLRFAQSTTTLNLSKDFGSQLGLKSFNLAVGGEGRIDRYQIMPGEFGSYGDYAPGSGRAVGAQVFPGFTPANAVDENRFVTAGYADIETDLTNNFLVNVAGRYEHYSDFGGNFAGKASARYKIADAFSIRGTVSNGFRAPSLHQRFFNNVATLFINTPQGLVASQTATFKNDSEIAAAFGIPGLKAEKSMNYSIGITSRPYKNINITVDAYQIEIKDRIVLSGDFDRRNNAIVNQLLQPFPNVTVARFFANAIDTRTRGLDVVINGNYAMGRGILDVTLAGNINRTEVIGNVKTTDKLPADSLNSNTLFNIEQRAIIERGQPRNKFMLNLNYRIGRMSFMLRNTRFGEVSTVFNGTDRRRDETFGAKVVTDASISVRPIHWMNITIGANNIADVYPDPIRNAANTGEGRFVYSRNATQFGFNGGYYYTNLNFDLTDIKRNRKMKEVPQAPVKATPPPPPAPDRDGDGVPDATDACPDQAGPASLQGCPDRDGDGVADKDDRCPDVAGIRIFQGCPDTDGDGIEDAKDKCPNVFGVAKYDGCPVPDTDGDGVNDEYDQCPTVPGLIANNGCPAKPKEEVQQEVDVKAKHILFVTGSARLTTSSYGALNDIATTIKNDASLEVEIEGHTDNTGGQQLNQKLSEDRAASVKNYLVSQGVSADKISTTGYGFSKPIADNKTAAGRAKNRRVVIIIK